MQTYRSISIVQNVAQAGALVIGKLAPLILLKNRFQYMSFPLPRFVGVDDIVQHQHKVRRLALPRVGFGLYTRTDAAYEHFELGGLEWLLFVDGADHVLGQ